MSVGSHDASFERSAGDGTGPTRRAEPAGSALEVPIRKEAPRLIEEVYEARCDAFRDSELEPFPTVRLLPPKCIAEDGVGFVPRERPPSPNRFYPVTVSDPKHECVEISGRITIPNFALTSSVQRKHMKVHDSVLVTREEHPQTFDIERCIWIDHGRRIT